MRTLLPLFLLSLAALARAADLESAAPSLSPAPITSLALFKNGTAVVTRRVTPAAEGPTLIDGRLAPAHGTFWTDAAASLRVEAGPRRVALAPEEVPERARLAETYAGRDATVWLRVPESLADRLSSLTAAPAPATLTVAEAPDTEAFPSTTVELHGRVLPPRKAARPAERRDAYVWYGMWSAEVRETKTPADRAGAFALRLPNGAVVRAPESAVLGVAAAGGDTAELPVLAFEGAKGPFSMQYLARGATWAPSYRLALGKGGKATFEMAAEIRNEMEDLDGAAVHLVSGFPNFETAEIPGFLAADNSVARFLDELSRPHGAPRGNHGGSGAWMSQMAWTQNIAPTDEFTPDAGLPQLPSEGAGTDIHYRSVGPVTLRRDATLRLPLGRAETTFTRLVDWDPGVERDDWWRPRGNADEEQRVPWDALTFRNPLPDPLTTGPVLAEEGGRPLGQTTVRWTNPGQEATVRVTKALTVPGSFEERIPGRVEDYPVVNHLGSTCRKVTVEASLSLRNHRPDEAAIRIHPTITGEFESATVEPAEAKNLPDGSGLNHRQALRWDLTLAPGASTNLTYRYTRYIYH